MDHTQHVTVIEELAQHLDDRYRSLLAQGATAAEAEQSVLQELEDEALDRELRSPSGAPRRLRSARRPGDRSPHTGARTCATRRARCGTARASPRSR